MTTGTPAAPRRRRFAPRVVPAGDAAQMLELGDVLDLEANATAQRVAEDVRAAQLEGVTDVVAAIATVTVYFEADSAAQRSARRDALSEQLLAALARAGKARAAREHAPVEIPVCYDADFGPDLDDVAKATGLTRDDVVRLHVESAHRVLMIGFTPGFPYIGGLDERLAVPRRATPRARVDAGSVAIAAGQTAVYPSATPGGWNLIGRTPLRLFDPALDPPSLLLAGDRVRFVPISAAEFEELASRTRGP
jgi:inhibitor of KinA